MARRPKHQKPALEAILKQAERRGWRVTRGKRYYKMYCPCERKCKKTVKLSPSDPNYQINLLGELKRSTCWEQR